MEILSDLLKQRSQTFLRPLVCASLVRSCHGWRQHQNTPQGSGQTSGNVSSAGQKYTPSGHDPQHPGINASGSLPETNAGPAQSTPAISSISNALTQLASQLNKQLCVVFGVQGPRVTLEVDQIRDSDLQSDILFLRKLRRRHFQLRGRLRSYFSFWRLSYWEFVKVRSTKPYRSPQTNFISSREYRCSVVGLLSRRLICPNQMNTSIRRDHLM